MRCARVTRCSPPRPPFSPRRHGGTERWGIEEAAQAVFQEWNVEVDEETNFFSRKSQICNELRFVNGQEVFDGLQLHDDSVVDEEIDLEIDAQSPAFVLERNGSLPLTT